MAVCFFFYAPSRLVLNRMYGWSFTSLKWLKWSVIILLNDSYHAPLYQWFPKCIVRLSKCSLGHLVPAKWHWIPYIIYAIVRIPLTIPPPQSLTKWHSQWEKVKWSSQIHSIATQFHLSKHLVHETPLPYPNYFSKLIQNS